MLQFRVLSMRKQCSVFSKLILQFFIPFNILKERLPYILFKHYTIEGILCNVAFFKEVIIRMCFILVALVNAHPHCQYKMTSSDFARSLMNEEENIITFHLKKYHFKHGIDMEYSTTHHFRLQNLCDCVIGPVNWTWQIQKLRCQTKQGWK